MTKTKTWGAATLCLPFMMYAVSAQAEMPHHDNSMMDHASNAMLQPIKDVNLRPDKIPQKLLWVQDHPYDLENMRGCNALNIEIASLDYILGPDVNQLIEASRTEKRERGVSRVAGAFIGGLIPFRGVVRELTGANASQRKFYAAIAAGAARRSFLKGVAVTKGCMKPPPAFQLRLAYNYAGF